MKDEGIGESEMNELVPSGVVVPERTGTPFR